MKKLRVKRQCVNLLKKQSAKRKKSKVSPTQKPNKLDLPKSESQSNQSNSDAQRLYWVFGLIGVVLVIWLSSLNGTPSTLVPTPTRTPQLQIPHVSTKTPSPISMPTKTPTATATPAPFGGGQVEATDSKGVAMRLVPSGEFIMGFGGASDALPRQNVYLDAYYIDKYEVTNLLYKDCVNAGICELPLYTKDYYDGQYANHPVVQVTWNNARTYCMWREARLPTEAEWEKAARGTDGRSYPWGEGISCSKANYSDCVDDSTIVGSYEGDQSVYGVYDLAGNVEEWVNSMFWNYPYSAIDGREDDNVSAPRVFRGGAWDQASYEAFTYDRHDWIKYDEANYLVGFRCARSVNP
ncbi:MAG: formylglycine-generating enzyme family protein [Anaerolineales bacterium]|nr:formylglycine-generating enzyme family protein [Anaerolineales bacterium]